jgi:hypothetical protein
VYAGTGTYTNLQAYKVQAAKKNVILQHRAAAKKKFFDYSHLKGQRIF